MIRKSTITAQLLNLSLLLAVSNVYADSGVCATASLINPYALGGISGTGAPAKGGVSGTGDKLAAGGVSGTGDKVAGGGVTGTGDKVAKGGVSGSGDKLAAGGVSGTGDKVAGGGVSGTGDKVAKGGVSGTGDKLAAGGVSGTGAPVAKGGGIGGTGDALTEYALLPTDVAGDIGIMGVVTGFASICVNGEEVHYESATPIYDNGRAAKLADLAVGKTVMLKVSRIADGSLHAKAIGMFEAVSGPVQNIDGTRQLISVMGQTVHINQAMVRELLSNNAGATARVSGYRLENGEIVASRLDLVSDSNHANTLGLVSGVKGDGFIVNGTKVTVTDKQILNKVKVGSEVMVSGNWSGDTLKASHIEAQPIHNVVSRVDSAILEGYVRKDGRNQFVLAGTEIKSEREGLSGDNLDKLKDKLVKVELRRNNSGKWVAEKVSERKGRRLDNASKFSDNQGAESDDLGQDDRGSDISSGTSGGSDDSSGLGSSESSGSVSSSTTVHGASGSGGSSSSGRGSSGSNSSSRGSSGSSGGSRGGSSGGSSRGGGSVSSGGHTSGGSSSGSGAGHNGGSSSGSSGGSSKHN